MIKELIKRVKLTEKEAFNLGLNTPYKISQALQAYGEGVADGAEAQLNKVLNDPDLALILDTTILAGVINQVSYHVIPLSEAIKKVKG